MEQNYHEGQIGTQQESMHMERTEVDVPIDICYSFLMMPFYFDEAEKMMPKGEKSIWEECNMTIDKGKLYNHIQKFIQSNNSGKGDYQYFSLKKEGSAKVIHEMLKMPMALVKRRQETEDNVVTFRFCLEKSDSFFSPKLVICANARVGVLILPVSLVDDGGQQVTINKLCDLNYALFKTYMKNDTQKDSTQNAHIFLKEQYDVLAMMDDTTKDSLKKTLQKIKEWTHDKNKASLDVRHAKKENKRKGAERKLKVSTEKLKELNSQLQVLLDPIRKQTSTDTFGNIRTVDQALQSVDRHCKEQDELLHYWTMLELTERLMNEFSSDCYQRFNPFRMHPFTYLRLNQSQFTPDIFDDFIRIVNVQNRNYQVMSENSNLYEQTFRNIYMGSSTEGGGIMTLLPEPTTDIKLQGNKENEKKKSIVENDEDAPYDFIKNFHNSSLSQGYIWIYLMVFVQRCTLLEIEKELSRFDFNDNLLGNKDNTPQKREQLRRLIKRMAQNEINTYFVDISDHTHHNKFYKLCSRNLMIKEYFTDVQRKTRTLKEYLSQLTDQRNEEMVARSEKITRVITIAGIVFALFSGLNDAFDLLGDEKLSLGSITQGLPIIVTHIIIILIFLLVPLLSWLLMNKYLHSSGKNNS
jgi:hypothetical protein